MAKKNNALRPILLWVGTIIGLAGSVALEIGNSNGAVGSVVGLIVTMIGCYLWTREKNRASIFALWGLLAPIGFLGIMFLRDKTPQQAKPYESQFPKND